MGRPRKYDPEVTRQALVRVFHENGFEAASLSELETATGLNRRQLYDGFGDKRELFTRALDDFAEAAAAKFLSGLETGPARISTIGEALQLLAAAAESPGGRLGCMICNTAREPALADPAVARRVDSYFRRIRNAYARCLNGACEAGELPPGAPVADLSSFLLGAQVSICVLARAGQDASQLAAIARETVTRLTLESDPAQEPPNAQPF